MPERISFTMNGIATITNATSTAPRQSRTALRNRPLGSTESSASAASKASQSHRGASGSR